MTLKKIKNFSLNIDTLEYISYNHYYLNRFEHPILLLSIPDDYKIGTNLSALSEND
jgi:hypothetical protein